MTRSKAVWLLAFLAGCGDRPAKEEARVPNRAPAFVNGDTLSIIPRLERDGRGNVVGAVTTVELRQGARDPDGDSLTYTWEALRFNGDTLVPAQLDAGRLSAKFRSGVMMNQAAGGLLKVTATDPGGLQAVKEICVSGGGFKC